MIFPLVIHKDRKSDYGITVPDLPGCFSAGSTIEDAIEAAREAILLHLDGLHAEGLPVPLPKPIEKHRRNRAFARAVWAVVDVEVATHRKPMKRARAA